MLTFALLVLIIDESNYCLDWQYYNWNPSTGGLAWVPCVVGQQSQMFVHSSAAIIAWSNSQYCLDTGGSCAQSTHSVILYTCNANSNQYAVYSGSQIYFKNRGICIHQDWSKSTNCNVWAWGCSKVEKSGFGCQPGSYLDTSDTTSVHCDYCPSGALIRYTLFEVLFDST